MSMTDPIRKATERARAAAQAVRDAAAQVQAEREEADRGEAAERGPSA